MATDPAAGETLTAGQTVTLTVCAGAGVELVKVPALQGETVDEAIADIKDAGLGAGGRFAMWRAICRRTRSRIRAWTRASR